MDTSSLHEIEQFLYREARLMDEHQYDAWLGLWVDEPHYWIPCNDDDVDGDITESIALVNEHRAGLEIRIERLKSGAAYSQDPKTRLSRVVSNVEILEHGGDVMVIGSTFNISAYRRGQVDVIAGRSIHTLRRVDQGLRLWKKKVYLANSDTVINNLTYLV